MGVESALEGLPGYHASVVSVAEGTVLVRYDGSRLTVDDLERAIASSPYTFVSAGPVRHVSG